MVAPRRHSSHRAFTAIELLVVIVILIILASIFVPYALKLRETSHRTQCRENLHQILLALQAYARDNGSMFPRVVHDPTLPGYTAFTGADDPNPFAPNSAVQPNDVTASLWLLVRGGYISDPRVFVCPSTDDVPESTDGMHQRSNFHGPRSLSYSYASPFSPVPGYRLTMDVRYDFAIMADANPGGVSGSRRVGFGAPQSELATINSTNHQGAGQNVLYNGAVTFQWNPYCAIDNDDIYSAQLATVGATTRAATTTAATTKPTTVPARAQGQLGRFAFPVSAIDSFLVPARDDAFAAPAPAPRAPATGAATPTAPATLPATSPSTTPAPGTLPAPAATTAPAPTQPTTRG